MSLKNACTPYCQQWKLIDQCQFSQKFEKVDLRKESFLDDAFTIIFRKGSDFPWGASLISGFTRALALKETVE